MVGYELLAQAQRDLTPEKVIKMKTCFLLSSILIIVFIFWQAAEQLREMSLVHYKERDAKK